MSSYINLKLEVRRCADPRLGKGVFAKKKIAKGEIIHVVEGQIVSNEELRKMPKEYANMCFDIGPDAALCPLDFKNPSTDGYINHSCNPNIGSAGDYRTLIAMRDIEAGEQVCMDYAMVDEDPDPYWDMECHCGASNCRNIITGNDWMLPALQERYQGYFQINIQENIDQLQRSQKDAIEKRP